VCFSSRASLFLKGKFLFVLFCRYDWQYQCDECLESLAYEWDIEPCFLTVGVVTPTDVSSSCVRDCDVCAFVG